jgi:hypothetical protein
MSRWICPAADDGDILWLSVRWLLELSVILLFGSFVLWPQPRSISSVDSRLAHDPNRLKRRSGPVFFDIFTYSSSW